MQTHWAHDNNFFEKKNKQKEKKFNIKGKNEAPYHIIIHVNVWNSIKISNTCFYFKFNHMKAVNFMNA